VSAIKKSGEKDKNDWKGKKKGMNGQFSSGKAAKEGNKKRFCTYCGQEFGKCTYKKKEDNIVNIAF
jgi:hypothetical protein